jgi:hypothetical protein
LPGIWGGVGKLETIAGEGLGGALVRSSFFFAGNLCRAFSRHSFLDGREGRHGNGGAMAEEEDDSGSEKGSVEGDGSGVRPKGGSDPKNGRVGGGLLLQRAADTAVDTYIADVIACLIGNIKKLHLPSAKLLMDLANRLGNKDISLEEFESLAGKLLKEVLEEPGQGQGQGQGIGNRE